MNWPMIFCGLLSCFIGDMLLTHIFRVFREVNRCSYCGTWFAHHENEAGGLTCRKCKEWFI